MTDDRSKRSPIGASITVDQLAAAPYETLALLREREPVSWVPAIRGWLVTRRDLAVHAMRDAATFTVDDPRFSTGAVIGPSMLSLDGPEHQRHRSPFAAPFRPAVVREHFDDWLGVEARRLVQSFAPAGTVELRTNLAGPLAVNTIATFLGLENVDPTEVLDWYRSLSGAIVDLTLGRTAATEYHGAIEQIRASVETTAANRPESLVGQLNAQSGLSVDELAASVAVVMFGAIETSEGMTANALWHLLTHPEVLELVMHDRSLVGAAVEESLRLEPAAAVVDRYTTRPVELGDVEIPERDLVSISLLGANRDPTVFSNPDRFDIARSNTSQHVSFVQGPHGCMGLHLARLETVSAVDAVLDALPGVRLVPEASTGPAGLIFRKPASVVASWAIGVEAGER